MSDVTDVTDVSDVSDVSDCPTRAVRRPQHGHVGPGQRIEPLEERRPRSVAVRPHELHQPRKCLFSIADDEAVEERGHWLGMACARPAADDERGLGPIPGPQRDPGQVEHGQDVGVIELILEGEPHHVELGQRNVGVAGAERLSGLTQGLLHVGPGREHEVHEYPRHAAQKRVQDPQAGVGHPDLVEVGVGEEDLEVPRRRLTKSCREVLRAQVAGRLLHIADDQVGGLH